MRRGLLRALWVTSLPSTALAQGVGTLRDVNGWLGAGFGLGHRNAAIAGSVGSGTGSGPYVQAGARYKFVTARLMYAATTFASDSGSEAVGKVSGNAALVTLGLPAIGAELGFGQRGFKGALAQRAWSFPIVGARGELPLGSSGLAAGAAAHLYLSPRESGGGTSAATGRAGETSLWYRPAKAPFFLWLAYRMERFTVEGTPTYPEEVSTVVLGGGVRRGR